VGAEEIVGELFRESVSLGLVLRERHDEVNVSEQLAAPDQAGGVIRVIGESWAEGGGEEHFGSEDCLVVGNVKTF
jgi:hypothetical protein